MNRATLLLPGLLFLQPLHGGLEPVAGTGEKGRSGDGGPAVEARLNNPFGIIAAPDGHLYLCDTGNHQIRRITREGRIERVAGSGEQGYSGDGGPALDAALNEPYEVRMDPQGRSLVWVERLNHCVRRMDLETGRISTLAGDGRPGEGGDGGPAVHARLHEPHSLQFDGAGNILVCDIKNHRLRRIDAASGIITTVCGTGEKRMPQAGAALAGSPLAGPRAVDFSADGTLWLALREGNAVFRLDLAAGRLHPVITEGLHGPKGLATSPAGLIVLADTEADRIVAISPEPQPARLHVLVGEKGSGLLARPHGVFVEADGAVLIGDSENHRVWRWRPD